MTKEISREKIENLHEVFSRYFVDGELRFFDAYEEAKIHEIFNQDMMTYYTQEIPDLIIENINTNTMYGLDHATYYNELKDIESYYGAFEKGLNDHLENLSQFKTQIISLFGDASVNLENGLIFEDVSLEPLLDTQDNIIHPFIIKEVIDKLTSIDSLDFVIFSNLYEERSYFFTIKRLENISELIDTYTLKEIKIKA